MDRRVSLAIRELFAPVARALSPGLGSCGRCGLPWSVVDGHSTDYTPNNGCFPLCERCWRNLGPTERLPYYRTLWEQWQDMGDNDASEQKWNCIEAAVKDGK